MLTGSSEVLSLSSSWWGCHQVDQRCPLGPALSREVEQKIPSLVKLLGVTGGFRHSSFL